MFLFLDLAFLDSVYVFIIKNLRWAHCFLLLPCTQLHISNTLLSIFCLFWLLVFIVHMRTCLPGKTKLQLMEQKKKTFWCILFSFILLHCYFQKIYSNLCYEIKYIVNVSSPASRRIPHIRSFRLLRENFTAHWASALTILTTVRYLKHTTINQCSVKQLISPFGSCESHSRLIHIGLAIVILLRCSNGHVCPRFLMQANTTSVMSEYTVLYTLTHRKCS